MTGKSAGAELRVGVLINDGSRAGLHLLHELNDHGGGVQAVFLSQLDRSGSKLERLQKWIARHGLLRTTDQLLGKLYRRLFLGGLERRQLAELLPAGEALGKIPEGVTVYRIPQVASHETAEAILHAELDVLFVMCKEMLPKRILALPKWGVIGQHPGITPHYRGSWSAFWALANGEPDMVGTSVFVMDEKADTGAVIYQERVRIDPTRDTFYSLTIKAEMLSATLMTRALLDLRNGCLTSSKIVSNRARTYFGVPGLADFVRFGWEVRRSILKGNTATAKSL